MGTLTLFTEIVVVGISGCHSSRSGSAVVLSRSAGRGRTRLRTSTGVRQTL